MLSILKSLGLILCTILQTQTLWNLNVKGQGNSERENVGRKAIPEQEEGLGENTQLGVLGCNSVDKILA